MAWAVLLISGLFEAGWAIALKASDGFSKLWPTVGFFAAMTVSLAGLGYALKTLPVGPAYAAWTGIGAVTTALIAILWLGESVSVIKVVSIVLIVAGIVGLNLTATAS